MFIRFGFLVNVYKQKQREVDNVYIILEVVLNWRILQQGYFDMNDMPEALNFAGNGRSALHPSHIMQTVSFLMYPPSFISFYEGFKNLFQINIR